MKDQRVKNTVKYVVPTILSDVCFFLFTIVDGIFVGRSVGTNGLGAINLVAPYILIIGAISMLINIGGVTICAIRIGKGDVNGANKTFRDLAADYLFWYSIFIIPAGLSMTLQNYCRNDGAPVLLGRLSFYRQESISLATGFSCSLWIWGSRGRRLQQGFRRP